MKLLEPDLRVVTMAESIRELATRVRRSAHQARARMGRWESDDEAFNLLLLSASFSLASAKLAKSSASFLPSAHLNARGGMEAGARALWLLQPEEYFTREARWVVHLESEADIRERLGRHSAQEAVNASAVRAFASAVRARLPDGTPVPKALPKFDKLLDAVGLPEKYIAYAVLSQSAHGTHYGAGLFRKHLGNQKDFGEFIATTDWWLPLSVQWWFLAVPAERLAERCGIAELRVPDHLSRRFIQAQKVLAGVRQAAR